VQQALAVATALRRPERQDIGKALRIVASSDVTRRVADRCSAAITEAILLKEHLETYKEESTVNYGWLLLVPIGA
jgi:hypothetical protein